ncbi:hypothetical protein ACIBED_02460 [Rhodococcus coprophilus]|uniref:Uncharacterized protein n=1 Tax=Rhodococcus coprophilus TaxID=38310 RepID=A0A2X4U873_9NOCA|nr:hypothetical protein [Rhodococcus coprophilus]MBM7461128.1 hypothetical protein [Rhodococcus coprophilus]SQI28930.1 Uncharacterised protein [Rhodococcus coprophilus]
MLRDATDGFVRALCPPRPCPRIRYRLLAAAVTALGGIAIALNAPHTSGLSGRLWVVSFLVVAPLVAIARLLPAVNAALALIVGAAGAAVVNALVAQSMLAADVWSPHGGIVAVGLAAAFLWLVPIGRPGAETSSAETHVSRRPSADDGDLPESPSHSTRKAGAA